VLPIAPTKPSRISISISPRLSSSRVTVQLKARADPDLARISKAKEREKIIP
jgi:hypothetical protein